MADISEYEQTRLKNIEENRRMLCQLGLLSEDWKPPVYKTLTYKAIVKPTAVKKKTNVENRDDFILPSRRSLRASLSIDFDDGELTDSVNGDYAESTGSNTSTKGNRPKRPQSYGQIEGVEIGDWWETRIECSQAGIHRPTVAGIHPGPEGAYSIALSGGYEDNYDGGYSFTYTGAGGRDLKGTKTNPKNLRTGPQVKDQVLDGSNGSLAHSVNTRNPVRVIRGYKSSSIYAPESGYRYDGLYQVEKYWTTKGLSGHLVYKFAFKRMSDQDPPPWDTEVLGKQTESKLPSETNQSLHKIKDVSNSSVELALNHNVEEFDVNIKTEPETSIESNLTNGKLHSAKKSYSPNSPINNNNDDEGSNDVVSVRKTPVKSEVNGAIGFKQSKEESLNTVGKSPKKKSPRIINKISIKSPAKMIASNQDGNPLPNNHVERNAHESKNKKIAQERLTADLQQALSECKVELMKLSYSYPVIPANDTSPKDNTTTSPDIFGDGDYCNYGKVKAENKTVDNNCVNSVTKSSGSKRSLSPDDFGKICDELCDELPKIEKVKKLRFSFDSFSNNDLAVNSVKTRRKTSRTPRKSSLVIKASSLNIGSPEKGTDGDLIFSNYSEMWCSYFKTTECGDWLGWDDYNTFTGWTDKELIEARKYSASFSNFMFNTNSEENSWAGWDDDVSRRSLVLNGFLLEEISRNKCSLNYGVPSHS